VTGFQVVVVRKPKPNWRKAGRPPTNRLMTTPASAASSKVAAAAQAKRKIVSPSAWPGGAVLAVEKAVLAITYPVAPPSVGGSPSLVPIEPMNAGPTGGNAA
jgi:hypothetical protein